MPRYLVVANQTVGGTHLIDEARRRMEDGSCSFHIVVPATAPHDHAVWTEGEANAIADRRLKRALARFREIGADVDGEIGDPDPMTAVKDCELTRSYDEIILSTLPPGISRWLKQDLPHRMGRACDVPVTHVIGEPDPDEPQG